METRGQRQGCYRKILVAYDGSPGARRALKAAIALADQSDAELHSISVEEKLPHYAATLGEVEEAKAERDAYFETLVREARQMAWDHGIELHAKVVPGHEVEAVIVEARQGGYDLLVVGFVGHSNVFGRVMGSTTQNLSRLSPCSVLVVK